jgi:hypothetical protein
MWADILLAAERGHLLRVATWGSASVVAGGAVLLLVTLRGARAPLLLHFGLQTVSWGALALALAALGWRALALRDVTAAARLLEREHLVIAAEGALLAAGIGLVTVGRRRDRPGAIGAGLALLLHGAALLVLDVRFARWLERAVP